MRIVLFDGIQEAHVGSSLERALVAAGHEVFNTGRFGKGFTFRDADDFFLTVRPLLDRIADFSPDWVLVFRPGSAPLPVLQALRSTGASLAVWLSDDPVLFDLSYGPVIDLYDLVLHCGNETVLRFYEERFGRPTGVNFPFWTDHHAFPAVYGQHEPDTTALFLGNVSGPVRQRRYDQLAGMRHRVRIFGQAGSDPAGLGGGFLDTDAEVVDAGSRTRVALNIPQFFRDHRGLQTWFPGLDDLGFFDLPSRVVQYSAMGIPTVSIIPGVSRLPAFPELVVCGSIREADEWIGDALEDGRLPGLSERTLARFDRSFSATARVRALESLMTDDGWRALDPAGRALWFLQFDGREAAAGAGAAGPGDSAQRQPAVLAEPPLRGPGRTEAGDLPDVVIVHGREPARFSPLDVVMRELRSAGSAPVVIGPEDVSRFLAPTGPPFTGLLEAEAFLGTLGSRSPRVLLLAEGIGLTADGAALLRRAGIATLYLLHGERFTPAQAGTFDLVVGVGPASVDRAALLQGSANAVRSPGLVETRFLQAVRDRLGQQARAGSTVVRTGENAIADWVLDAAAPGPGCEASPGDLATADLGQLAGLLARDVVYLQPSENGRRKAHPPVTPYAVCASPTVLTTRHRSPGGPDVYGDWLVKAETPAEAALKLARRGPDRPDLAGLLDDRHRALDARRQLAEWFRLATAAAEADGTDRTATGPVLQDSTACRVHLDHRYVLDTAAVTRAPGQGLTVILSFADAALVRGLRLGQGDRTVAEARFPAGSAGAVEVTVAGGQDEKRGPLTIEVLGDPVHRLRDTATVRVATRMGPGPRLHGITEDADLTAVLLPVSSGAGTA